MPFAQSHIEGHLLRLARGRARANSWCDQATAQATTAAAVLVRDFQAQRVVLFGSVARRDGGPGSDVDILVAGIAPARWFDACAAASDAIQCGELDLVPAERVHAHVLARVALEGVVLHG